MTNVDIKTRIEEIQQETRRAKIADIETIQTFWTEVLKDPRAKTADRLKASELLARSQGVFLRAFERAGDLGGAVEDVILYLPDNGRGDGGTDGA